MAAQAPTVGQIRTAKSQAVGGMRKRCRKGKNCSAACIQAGMACLVQMPESAGRATTKVRNMLQQRMGGKMPAPAAPTAAMMKPSAEDQQLKAQAKGVLREEKAAKPPREAKPNLNSLREQINKAREEYEMAYRTPGAKAAKEKYYKLIEEYNKAKAGLTGRKLTPAEALSKPISKRTLTEKPAIKETGKSYKYPYQDPNDWRNKYAGRSPELNDALTNLRKTVDGLPPERQAYWNEQINKQMNPKLASRNGTPYSPERTNRSLTSQAKAWTYLIQNGPPAELTNRIGEKRPAPKGMIPDVTSSGQRKWISPDDGLKYSLNKGSWRQNRVSKADTDRRLPDITNFRKEQQAAGAAWPTQKLPAREGLPKTAAEVIKTLTNAEKNAIVFNGLDATGNEGIKLRAYYNANPREKEARLTEIVQRWHDQGGRSGVSGKPVALPGLEPKKGEERSSVDHFQPISTNRAASLPAAEMRKLADNYKNFLIAEEGPNSQRGARTWDSWLDRREGAGAKPARAPSTKNLNEDQKERVSNAARMTNFRIDKRLNERQFYDDETNAKIKAANQEVVAPFQKMKPNEKAALSLYGQDGVKYYQQVNQMLRTGEFEGSTAEKKQMAEFIAGNLKAGLLKLPPAQVEKLERAVSGNFASSLGQLRVGDVIQDKGFGSYTDKGAPVLDRFMSRDAPNAMIQVRNPRTARGVAPVMEYSTEGEHISLPGTRYRLAEIQEKGYWSRKTAGYVPTYIFEEVEE